MSGATASLLPVREVGRVACGCELAESPLWIVGSPRSGTLLWVDVPRGTLHHLAGEQHEEQVLVKGALAAIAGPMMGRLIAVGDRSVYAIADVDVADASRVAVVAEIPDDPPGVVFNDAKEGPDGRVWLATVSRNTIGGAALWTYATQEGLVLRRPGVSHGNGLGWNAAATRMHFVDSGAGTLTSTRFDSASAAIGAVEFQLAIPREDGIPDGLAVDAEDCVWLALWGGHGLLRISPSGSILGRVDLPELNVTSCAFVGPGLATLAVTTAADDVDPSAPGGDVHLLDVGVAGAAVGASESTVRRRQHDRQSSHSGSTAKE